MVFAAAASCPCDEPFQWFDHKAVVVLDKDALDVHALRLACLWARWTARRESAEACQEIDAAKVEALVESARRVLKTVTTIRGDHTRACTSIRQAGVHLDALVADLSGILDQLEDELGVPQEESA